MAIKHICPYCGNRKFSVTVHVTQDWAVDEDGNWLETIQDCLEVTHFPNDDDEWDCIKCGRPYPSGKPFYFTFGSDPAFPFQDTYLIVFAESQHDAIAKFKKKHPDRPGREGICNMSSLYTQEQWIGSANETAYGDIPAEVII